MLVEHAMQWAWQAMGGTRIEVLCTFLVFLGVLLVARCLQWLKHVSSLPPGPWGVPVFGYLPFLKGDVHLQYGELAKKYGPMFSARLGTQLVVILSDHRTIRDTFRREEFTGRPHTEFINILGGYGIINTEGAMWKDQRKFLHDKLRSFGMTYMGSGKKIMESKIMREVKIFLRGMALRRGVPTDVSASLGTSISNVICSIIMGVRFRHGDSRFKRFMDLIEEGFKLFGSMAAVNFIPVMRYLPCLQKIRNKISENRAEMAEFFQQTVDQHRATLDQNTVRDLVDAYLLEIEKAEGEGRASLLFQGKNHGANNLFALVNVDVAGCFYLRSCYTAKATILGDSIFGYHLFQDSRPFAPSDRQMQQILGDLFSAGMETVKTTLEWAIILMLHHPEAAIAVREELDQVVGKSRMPGLEDLSFLPVTEATILEVLRRSSVVPLGTTHATTRDVTLHGYTIPAGSQVVPLLHAVHMDPELWEKPEEFRPSRFLSAEGKVQKPEYFMPFGVGRRMCLGDVLARMELFLFFSSLMHTFDLRSPEGASLPSLRGNAGVTVTPDPFDVCLFPRNLDLIEDASNVAGL